MGNLPFRLGSLMSLVQFHVMPLFALDTVRENPMSHKRAEQAVRHFGFDSIRRTGRKADGYIFSAKKQGKTFEVQVSQAPRGLLAVQWVKVEGSQRNPKGEQTRFRVNPKDIFDPRLEQVRAQRQAIYETSVCKALGIKDFRNSRHRRADIELSPAELARCAQKMFSIGTGVPRRDERLVRGTQTPTPKSIAESRKRYEDVDRLIRNRQDYEETLGLTRKSGFYRVVPEPTTTGLGFFVWPLPPGERLPLRAEDVHEAEYIARDLNRKADPRATGRWWKPPARSYTRKELVHWLPPEEIWR